MSKKRGDITKPARDYGEEVESWRSRLATIVDEAFGMQESLRFDALLTRLEQLMTRERYLAQLREQATKASLVGACLLVVIESPYAGTVVEVERNVLYARAAMLDSLLRGEAPFASHLLYTQVLDDTTSRQRVLGIQAGLCWGRQANLVAVYEDLGISNGMALGIESALSHGVVVVYRSLGGWDKAGL